MAYTSIERSFWTDPVMRSLGIKERYLYLYLLTNHHAHYSGVYYLPYTYIIEESGITKKEIDGCFKKLCKKIQYDNDTSVIWIVNMFKYQNSKGGNPKVIYSGIEKHFKNLHSFTLIREFILKYREFIPTLNQGWFKDASRLRQPIGTDTVTDSGIDTDTDTEKAIPKEVPYLEIVNYLNEKASTSFRSTTEKTQQLIKVRMNEGFSFEDFKTVIDKIVPIWKVDPKMIAYIRPETLFGTKFEGYLNQNGTNPSDEMDGWLKKMKEKGEIQ